KSLSADWRFRYPSQKDQAKAIKIPVQGISSGGRGSPPPEDWAEWLEATDDLKFLTLGETGDILRAKAQDKSVELYSFQGLTVPTKLFNASGLAALVAGLVWFTAHANLLISTSKAKRNEAPFYYLLIGRVGLATVLAGAAALPAVAAALSSWRACAEWSSSRAYCGAIGAEAVLVCALIVGLGWIVLRLHRSR
ncbi:MAG: hypothetical protein MK186_12710, partial [Henriciella sp.]|nr:hypothetical protein [Henriciella sp.]